MDNVNEGVKRVVEYFESFVSGILLNCDGYVEIEDNKDKGVELSFAFEINKMNYFLEVSVSVFDNDFERLKIDTSVKPGLFTKEELEKKLDNYGNLTFLNDIGSVAIVTIADVTDPEDFNKILNTLLEGYN